MFSVDRADDESFPWPLKKELRFPPNPCTRARSSGSRFVGREPGAEQYPACCRGKGSSEFRVSLLSVGVTSPRRLIRMRQARLVVAAAVASGEEQEPESRCSSSPIGAAGGRGAGMVGWREGEMNARLGASRQSRGRAARPGCGSYCRRRRLLLLSLYQRPDPRGAPPPVRLGRRGSRRVKPR